MNEACSAGTGSFLEESALETLGVKMEEIAEIALKGRRPPNFNDQCAAFIASDIKNAIHEGVAHEDIVAGLVYSICMNYANRVKGNRPVGEKVFMQGGVCYNRAVPLAMAALVGKPIIVPPEPGLMGAFGVALEVQKRIENGLMAEQHFDLATLAGREVVHGKAFTCRGGEEKCDRRCPIAVIEVEHRKYPFGGACNRYYNLRHNVHYDVDRLDLVSLRRQLVFETYGVAAGRGAVRRAPGPGRPQPQLSRQHLLPALFPFLQRAGLRGHPARAPLAGGGRPARRGLLLPGGAGPRLFPLPAGKRRPAGVHLSAPLQGRPEPEGRRQPPIPGLPSGAGGDLLPAELLPADHRPAGPARHAAADAAAGPLARARQRRGAAAGGGPAHGGETGRRRAQPLPPPCSANATASPR